MGLSHEQLDQRRKSDAQYELYLFDLQQRALGRDPEIIGEHEAPPVCCPNCQAGVPWRVILGLDRQAVIPPRPALKIVPPPEPEIVYVDRPVYVEKPTPEPDPVVGKVIAEIARRAVRTAKKQRRKPKSVIVTAIPSKRGRRRYELNDPM